MPKKQCTTPMCPEYAEEGHSKCKAHKKEYVRSQFDSIKKPEYAKLYNTKAWQNLRNQHRRANPICVECGQWGEVVDHKIPHKGDVFLFYDQRNLQTLCNKCHNKKTGRGQ